MLTQRICTLFAPRGAQSHRQPLPTFVERRTPIPNALFKLKTIHTSPRPDDAINRCVRARANAYQAEFAISKSKAVASLVAAEAYRHAMPLLSSPNNICDFVSCVAHALLIGVLDESKGSKLLYAAQIASTSLRAARGK